MSSLERLLAERRSHYRLGGRTHLSDEELMRLVTACICNTPSMFDMQSTRVIVLFNDEHAAFWKMCRTSLTAETLAMRPNVGWQQFS